MAKPNFQSHGNKSGQARQQSAQRRTAQGSRQQKGLNGSKNHRDSLKGGGGNNTGKKNARNFLGF